MRLFVGLGNPGAKYAGNRHNIGFMALDRIAADHGFGPWKKAHQGLACEGRLGLEKVVLLKPETFMNLSGQSVHAAVSFYKLGLNEVTVFHDELDLAPGKIRVKTGGGHAGHNGLRSIDQHLGPDFRRVRIGIGQGGLEELLLEVREPHGLAEPGPLGRPAVRLDELDRPGVARGEAQPFGVGLPRRERRGGDALGAVATAVGAHQDTSHGCG